MKDFFEPEDFCDMGFAEMDYACDQANKKLNKLIESCPVVYLNWGTSKPYNMDFNINDHSHKARLAFIEEIKKEPCKHEPNTYETSTIVEGFLPARPGYFSRTESEKCIFISPKCQHCGIELQATWSEKK